MTLCRPLSTERVNIDADGTIHEACRQRQIRCASQSGGDQRSNTHRVPVAVLLNNEKVRCTPIVNRKRHLTVCHEPPSAPLVSSPVSAAHSAKTYPRLIVPSLRELGRWASTSRVRSAWIECAPETGWDRCQCIPLPGVMCLMDILLPRLIPTLRPASSTTPRRPACSHSQCACRVCPRNLRLGCPARFRGDGPVPPPGPSRGAPAHLGAFLPAGPAPNAGRL